MLLKDQDLSKIVPADHAMLRAGIIPYVKHDGDIWFLMGVHTETSEYSDFGGGVKQYENALSAALRECKEESRGIIDFCDLGTITMAILERKYKQNVCIMFSEIKTEGFFETAVKKFRKTKPPHPHKEEIKDLVWLKSSEMINACQLYNKRSKVWYRIRYTLTKKGIFNKDFVKELKKL